MQVESLGLQALDIKQKDISQLNKLQSLVLRDCIFEGCISSLGNLKVGAPYLDHQIVTLASFVMKTFPAYIYNAGLLKSCLSWRIIICMGRKTSVGFWMPSCLPIIFSQPCMFKSLIEIINAMKIDIQIALCSVTLGGESMQVLKKLRLQDLSNASQEDSDSLLEKLTGLTFLEWSRTPKPLLNTPPPPTHLPSFRNLACLSSLQVSNQLSNNDSRFFTSTYQFRLISPIRPQQNIILGVQQQTNWDR